MKQKFSLIFSLVLILAMVITTAVVASSVDIAVVDVTAPTGSVTLAPGGSGAITINMSVTGKQEGTATFEVYKNWTLSDGNFVGSNSQEFTVAPRAAQDPATTFTTTGTVTVASTQAAGTFTLEVGAFDITNSNTTGGKLTAGSTSNYNVIVEVPVASDTTPPTLHLPANITIEATSDSGAVVTFAATADDTAPLHPTVTCLPASGSTFPLGTKTVNCSATDTANNTAYGSFTITVSDTTPPVIASHADVIEEATSALGAFVSYEVPETSDAVDGAGIATCAPVSGSQFNLGDTIVTCNLADAAGNNATPTTFVVYVVDTTPPLLGTCDAPDGLWHAGDVTLHCAYTDLVSDPSQVSLTTSIAVGVETDNAIASANGDQACDAAGNCAESPADIPGNKVDKKAPTNIAFVGGVINGGVYYFGFVPGAPTCTATDGGSGLDECVVSGYSTATGSHTLTATATDNVGNFDTATLIYEVKKWELKGFYAPVDMNGIWNVIKGGQTVPLKFNIFAGPNELKDISYIDRFEVKGVACPSTGATTDDIELTTTGGTTLRYDVVGGQFVQNWQTPKKSGVCYSVTMYTDDDSFLSAFFKLK